MKKLKKTNLLLFILLIVFCIFGLLMVYSASSASTVLRYKLSSSHFFVRQLIVVAGSFIMGFIILLIPTKKYKWLGYLYFLIMFALLVYVLFEGKVVGNAKSWIPIGSFNLQPAEFIKTAIIIFMAFFYEFLYKSRVKKSIYFFPLLLCAMVFLLVAKQPDLGSGLIIIGISGAIFLSLDIVKKNKKYYFKFILPIMGALLLASPFIYKNLSDEKKSRLTEFANPCARYQDESGYQVCNGYIAIANGGLTGVGLGKSTQKYLYLPESHTDFIFPIICEECGAIIGVILIIGYFLMLTSIFKIANNATNTHNKIMAYGAFTYLAMHVLVNLLGILALVPLTGVPLPFLSYGGSFTINAILMVFICQRIAIENNITNFKRKLSRL